MWISIALTSIDAMNNVHGDLMNKCGEIWMASGAPSDAALFSSDIKDDIRKGSGMTLYFSPKMAEICSSLLRQYSTVTLSLPPTGQLSTLLSSGDVSYLLSR